MTSASVITERLFNSTKVAERITELQQQASNYDITTLGLFFKTGLLVVRENIWLFVGLWGLLTVILLLYAYVFDFLEHSPTKVPHFWGVFITVQVVFILYVFVIAPLVIGIFAGR